MMHATKEKLYLKDYPEFDAIIKEFIDDLSPNYSEGYLIKETEAIECIRRDGFIPHSHNHGGYDKEWITDLMSIWGSGCEIGKYTQEVADNEAIEAAETYIKYDAENKDKKLLATIPEDKRNYHDLYELGHSELAETMDEYCSDWLRDDSIYYGYRAMYEGQQGCWHTLMIYASANRSQYFGAQHGDTLGEFEIKFRNANELKTKLKEIKTDLESCL
jgi:hypothetical protein